MGTAATTDQFAAAHEVGSDKWTTILSPKILKPGYPGQSVHYFDLQNEKNYHEFANSTWTHIRVNIYPDGGVARLRTYGEVRFCGLQCVLLCFYSFYII